MAKRPKRGDQASSGHPESRSLPAESSLLTTGPNVPVEKPSLSGENADNSATQPAAGAIGSGEKSDSAIPVIGIGASAGGLDAFKKLFSNMPADSGAAFVLVPHLDPTHDSLMVELVARYTNMPVCEARDEMAIEPNCIYIIPPNKYLALVNRKLTLSKPADRHSSPTAIDYFFRSMAADQHERAIGIILSGTSSHGTAGLKEIKLAGGMMMVQQPESAQYDQMPLSAIATGLIDFVLPPEQMPDALVKYLRHPYLQGGSVPVAEDATREQLNRILALLKTRTKYDFRSYRKNMLTRRVLRRMGLCHLEQMSEYLEFLRDHPDELTLLYKDLLIGVTDFFRDPEAFQVLQTRVIPELTGSTAHVTPAEEDDSGQRCVRTRIRVWIPACSTGEEAYSIAMMLVEQIALENKPFDIQIFATDIDERSLETARQGIYSESSVIEITPERQQRFFTRIDAQRWQVNKQLRETITFAPQNLISDAPFSKLDLISCRNLLIYLEPDVQAKVIRLFHFALSEGGFLLLGPAESIGREVDLFEPVSKKWRVFRKIGSTRRALVEIPIVATEERRRLRAPQRELTTVPATGLKELMQRLILEEYAPASALINGNHEIVCVLGPLTNYLEFPPGELTRDLLAMARPGLRTKIRAAVHQAVQTDKTVIDLSARVKRGGVFVSCSITVKPVFEQKDVADLLLVTFQDREAAELAAPGVRDGGLADESESHLLRHLEHELKSTREDLQSTIEEYESSNEELKASNEEVMSMNEELQSANEELETSKEELQSLNEELGTVNSQLQEKVEELDRSNGDLINLMASSKVATVFLDVDLRIKRFTPPVSKLLSLRSTDIDRPFSDIAPKFFDDTLLTDSAKVLETLIPIEKEVWIRSDQARIIWPQRDSAAGEDQRISPANSNASAATGVPRSECYLRRILPYRTPDNRIDGVVITFFDITQRIASEAQARRLATVLCDSNDAVTVHDFDGKITSWNRGAERMYGYTAAEALRMNIRDIVPEGKRTEAFAYIKNLARDQPVEGFETQRVCKDGRILDVGLTVTAYRDEHERPTGVATTERDITERKRAVIALQRLSESLEKTVEEQNREVKLLAEAISHLGEGVIITGDDLDWPGPIILFVNQAMCQITGYTADELIGQSPRILQGEETDSKALESIKQKLSAGQTCTVEMINYRKDGSPYDADLFITPLFDFQGQRTNFVSIHRDISERKRVEQALFAQESLGRSILDSMTAHVAVLDRDGRIVRVNAAWERFAKVNGASVYSHTGVGANYLEVCQRAVDNGDELAAQILGGLRGVLERQLTEYAVEYPCHSEHEQRWFLMTAAPILEGPYGAVISHFDITDRKQAEAAVKDREERMHAVLNTAIDAIVTIDLRGVITNINPATEQMFGYSRDELLGRNVRMLMPPPYCDEHDAYLARYLKTGEARMIGIGGEVVGRKKDGSNFPVDLAVSQVNHMGLFTGIVRDISQRKELQKQVLEIAVEEQRRIGQELHDGTGQELTGLALFAGTLSDHLHTLPRKAIDGTTTWLLEEAELARIRQTAARLTEGLAEAHKHVQKLSHGIMPVQIEAEGLRSALEELAASTNIAQKIECHFECSQPVTVADNTTATHLYRIAQEAVNNAVRHGRASKTRIALTQTDDEIVLEVGDNGIGLDPTSLVRGSAPGRNHGFGLEIMNYRAGIIGGTFRVSRGEAGGTLVKCVIPQRRM